jgi:hypothetical protein
MSEAEKLLEKVQSICNDLNRQGARIFISGDDSFVSFSNSVSLVAPHEVLRRYEELRKHMNNIWSDVENLCAQERRAMLDKQPGDE